MKTLNLVCTQGPIQVHRGAQGPLHDQGSSPHHERKRTNISYQKKILQAHGHTSEELNAREGLGRDVTVEKDR